YTVSWDIIGLFPRPTEGGGVLRIDYNAWPRELLDDDDIPEIQQASHDAIVAFGAYLGELKKWDNEAPMIAWERFKTQGALTGGRSAVQKVVHRHFDRSGPNNRSEYQQR